ncbi:MAG: hypothetical protein JO002_08510 [Burkholderiaceae bacterium]|nr:hypothetical protein [Burkholderiaceae bacterium]
MQHNNQISHTAARHDMEPASEMASTIDAKGRVLKIKAPDIVAQARFERVFGGENMKYRLIMGALNWLRVIDGETIVQPASLLAYEALLQRVGEEALCAIVECIAQMSDGGAKGVEPKSLTA